jgi:hypothetical protein
VIGDEPLDRVHRLKVEVHLGASQDREFPSILRSAGLKGAKVAICTPIAVTEVDGHMVHMVGKSDLGDASRDRRFAGLAHRDATVD